MDHRIAVLVVEDEALIRMEIVSELEDAGFQVFEAAHADAAIEILIANLTIRVMFTDIDLPGGMDGLKLAAAVRDRWPPIKIIVTSGHQTINAENLGVEGRFVQKPYNTRQAVQSINEMVGVRDHRDLVALAADQLVRRSGRHKYARQCLSP